MFLRVLVGVGLHPRGPIFGHRSPSMTAHPPRAPLLVLLYRISDDSDACRAGSNSSVEEMLGNQGVTESNMMQYLGIIEQRTSEILQAYAASQQMTQAVETQVTSGFLGAPR